MTGKRSRARPYRPGGLLPGAAMVILLLGSNGLSADPREAWDGLAFPWLEAIGKLQVPGSRYQEGRRSHHLEDCSATLVAQSTNARATTILSAWHCLEGYDDLSKPITFTLRTRTGEELRREVYRLADGGGMHADWAILRLYKALPKNSIVPLIVSLQVDTQQADASRPVFMAGYSRDSGIGNDGEVLSYDPACHITHQARDISDTDCTAHKGSSGGAVVQLTGDGQAQVYGVISEGNGTGRSTFVPVSYFSNALKQYVN